MRAEVGDEIVVRGRHAGDEDRKGVVIEVHGEGGAPLYLVRWQNGHDSVFMPSSDSLMEHHPAPARWLPAMGRRAGPAPRRGTGRISQACLRHDPDTRRQA